MSNEHAGCRVVPQPTSGRLALALASGSGPCLARILLSAIFENQPWSGLPFGLGGLAVVLCAKVADRHVDDYEAHVATVHGHAPGWTAHPLAIGKDYLDYESRRASLPQSIGRILVWASWAFPIGFFAFLFLHAFWILVTTGP